jgi:hypothetical protein
MAPTPEIAQTGKKGATKVKAADKAAGKEAWPADLLEQTQAVRDVADALQGSGIAVTPDSVAARFARAPRARVREILLALETLGFIEPFHFEIALTDADSSDAE